MICFLNWGESCYFLSYMVRFYKWSHTEKIMYDNTKG